MSLHVYQSGWKSFCDDAVTLDVYKSGVAQPVKKTDYIYANSQWQTVCPLPNYPFGFDYVNRQISITPDFPNPTQYHHVINFENSTNDYPWGGANDFTLRCYLDVEMANEVEVRAQNPLGTIIWQFGPVFSPGVYNQIYDFPMNAVNSYMQIQAFFRDSDQFTIQTEVLAGSGGSEYLDFSGIPFPTNYDSND